jgi:hypothetical protein
MPEAFPESAGAAPADDVGAGAALDDAPVATGAEPAVVGAALAALVVGFVPAEALAVAAALPAGLG